MLKKPTATTPRVRVDSTVLAFRIGSACCAMARGWTTTLLAVALPPQAPDPYQLVRARVTQGLEAVCSVYVFSYETHATPRNRQRALGKRGSDLGFENLYR